MYYGGRPPLPRHAHPGDAIRTEPRLLLPRTSPYYLFLLIYLHLKALRFYLYLPDMLLRGNLRCCVKWRDHRTRAPCPLQAAAGIWQPAAHLALLHNERIHSEDNDSKQKKNRISMNRVSIDNASRGSAACRGALRVSAASWAAPCATVPPWEAESQPRWRRARP
jgi:hypothetical protein